MDSVQVPIFTCPGADGTAVVEPARGVPAWEHEALGHGPQPHLAGLAFRALDLYEETHVSDHFHNKVRT